LSQIPVGNEEDRLVGRNRLHHFDRVGRRAADVRFRLHLGRGVHVGDDGGLRMLGRCQLGTPLCSHLQTCAYREQWHIGWDILLNGLNPRWWWYLLSAFFVPVLYGSWKWSLYHFLVGPLLASLTTTDVNERPAVWCLFSTCIIALLVNTRVRGYIYVKRWPTWGLILRWRRGTARASNPGG